jgi:hypothetical protein
MMLAGADGGGLMMLDGADGGGLMMLEGADGGGLMMLDGADGGGLMMLDGADGGGLTGRRRASACSLRPAGTAWRVASSQCIDRRQRWARGTHATAWLRPPRGARRVR